MKEKNSNSYFLGLDIGTDSIGYAAVDETYSLLKFRGEPVWGVSLFDEAAGNADRRNFRTGRRRLDRRQQRVQWLSELFAAEIGKIDEKFFIRLKSSALYPEDKDEPGSLFGGSGYTDADYHRDYPTIHHLIDELMNNPAPHDVRLVYLACAWLVAHRGHFLNEVETDVTDFDRVWEDFLAVLQQEAEHLPWENDAATRDALKEILKGKQSVTVKYRNVCQALFGTSKAPKEVPDFPWNLELLLKLLCGSKVDAAKLFNDESYAEIGSFSLNSKEEELAGILAQLGQDAQIIECAKAVSDWALLADILEGYSSISKAKIAVYEQHKKDLAFLKAFVKKYLPDKYREIFQEFHANNYTAYAYHYKSEALKQPLKSTDKRADKEEFCAYLSKLVSGIEPEESDRAGWEDMKHRLETRSFLPKQRDTDNRVIPHQVYEKELAELLKNAAVYLPFLSEKDKNGITVSDKIRAIFAFRIPYFVGPLNPHSERAWIKFLPGAAEPIRPWNYNNRVDETNSEEEFIRKMTNKCTYLPGEDVLPKKSLLYTAFTVLNEINNLKIDGEKISVGLKQKIYVDLFLHRRGKVTLKKLENYLCSINAMQAGQTLSGVDQTVKSDLTPWHDYGKLLSEGQLTPSEVEKIIERNTYSEEKLRFRKFLDKNYPQLSEEDRRYLARLDYKDFGALSRRFLLEFYGVDLQAGTGEAVSIIHTLWDTNYNLNEILFSDRFTFKESLETERQSYYAAHPQKLEERMSEMRLSNSVKRSVFRALAIVQEVTKAVGSDPAKIFIEMTRGGNREQKGKRTISRKEQLLALYEKCADEDVRLLREELEKMGNDADSKLQSEALFLYYTQLGKCMYSGQPIELEKLKDGSYNIDHIWPQSFVKDDSLLDNKVLVISQINGTKSDVYPIDAKIRQKMHSFWSRLKDTGLITEEKYRRLTRTTPFTDEEKLGFIHRQLTETSQSSKAVATLLKEKYPNTDIVYVKARLAAEFRQEFDLLKSRTFNDLHHAKDAYLNIVTGNVYDMKFSKNWFNVHEPYRHILLRYRFCSLYGFTKLHSISSSLAA